MYQVAMFVTDKVCITVAMGKRVQFHPSDQLKHLWVLYVVALLTIYGKQQYHSNNLGFQEVCCTCQCEAVSDL